MTANNGGNRMMLRTLAKAHDALTHWSFVAATVLLGIIFCTYCLEVVLR